MAGQPKVSVVVAVYNPGPNIDGLVSSLDAQSLGPDELEVVFVDDGSTDGTHEHLLEIARSRPHVVLATIANSGWPGRPRNVGTDLARGDYVFYADHDDEFFPQALERMHAMARTNGSDVVYGKVVRVGLNTPYWQLAKADKEHADLVDDDLMISRSTHKLYRREFLLEHDIRFLEGRVRLEDHHFMGQVLACSPSVSILASQPCYRWIHRKDGTNSSSKAIDLESYFGYFTASVQLLQTNDVQDRVRDEIAVVSALRMFLALRARPWLRKDRQSKEEVVKTLRTFLETCVPAHLDKGLPVLKSLAVSALRNDDLEAFDAVQAARTSLHHQITLESVTWDDGRVLIGVDASLVDAAGNPLVMDELGDGLALPSELGAPSGAAAAPRVLSATDRGAGEITVQHRGSAVEWPVNSLDHPKAPSAVRKATLSLHVDGSVDPAHSFFGHELEAGIWDVLLRVEFLGESRVRPLPIAETAATDCLDDSPQQIGDRKVVAYRTKFGTLALKISAPGPQPSVSVLTADWESGDLVVALDHPKSPSGTLLVVRQRGVPGEQRVQVRDGRARITLGPSVRGDIFDFWLRPADSADAARDQRLAFGAADVSQRPSYRIYATVHGSFSVKDVEPKGLAPKVVAPKDVKPHQSPDPLAGRARQWLSRRRWPWRPGGSS